MCPSHCDPRPNTNVNASENLGKEGYLIFTFDDQEITGHQMYKDYFPTIWRWVVSVGICIYFVAYAELRVIHLQASGKCYGIVPLGFTNDASCRPTSIHRNLRATVSSHLQIYLAQKSPTHSCRFLFATSQMQHGRLTMGSAITHIDVIIAFSLISMS